MEAGAEEKEKVEVCCDGLGKISTSVTKIIQISVMNLVIERVVASIHKSVCPQRPKQSQVF